MATVTHPVLAPPEAEKAARVHPSLEGIHTITRNMQKNKVWIDSSCWCI